MMGDVNRAADRVSEIVFLVWRPRQAVGVVEKFIGIEEVIAQVFKRAAVKGTAAGLGFYFDSAGAISSVLRAVARSENFEFGDRFRVGVPVQRGVGAVVHVVAAIQFPVVVLGAAAVHAVGHVAVNAYGAFILVC